MNVKRPQEYLWAALFVLGAIGPALLGLVLHLAWVGMWFVWGAIT